jgi:hypothetical protein
MWFSFPVGAPRRRGDLRRFLLDLQGIQAPLRFSPRDGVLDEGYCLLVSMRCGWPPADAVEQIGVDGVQRLVLLELGTASRGRSSSRSAWGSFGEPDGGRVVDFCIMAPSREHCEGGTITATEDNRDPCGHTK